MPSVRAKASRSSPSPRSRTADLLQQLLEAVLELPPHAVYLVIGALAAVENIFPPVPADTVVALGGFLAGAGKVSALNVFLITWAANVLTATSVYLAGRTIGRSFFRGRLGRKLVHPRHVARLERLYHRHGSLGLFLSRFIPGVRAVLPPFAGVARLSFWRSVPPMALASGLWYGALTYAAAALVTQLDDVAAFVRRFNAAAFLLAASVAAALAAFVWWRHRRLRLARAGPQTPEPAPPDRGPAEATDHTPSTGRKNEVPRGGRS